MIDIITSALNTQTMLVLFAAERPNAPFFLFFRNSAIIATLTTMGVVVSSSLVA